jgi:hypothetical protein
MLTNYAYDYYRSKSSYENADYFFDKSTEFMKIVDVIEKTAEKLKNAANLKSNLKKEEKNA